MRQFRNVSAAVVLACAAAFAPGYAQADANGAAAASAEHGAATTFVRSLIDDLGALVSEAPEGSAARSEGLADILAQRIATRRMQGFVLSSAARDSATPEQLAAYDRLFEDYISVVWAKSIDQLVSRRIDLDDARQRKANEWVVSSKIFNKEGQPRADIYWQVLDVEGELKLVNVTVRGQSFASDLRAQFSALVKNEGFDELIAHMESVLVG
ncbi:MAG: ABC transporter substrate-binding protein [Pseudomonadota bacterium]